VQLLQQLHDKTTRKLSPAKAVDPFTILPVEIAEMILEYLQFNNMVNCMRVSRGWRDYLSKLPRLWMHLDMSKARKPVPRSFVDKAVRRSQNRLIRLTLHQFQHIDVVRNIVRVCKNLEDFEIRTLPTQTAGDSLIGIVQSAQNLKKIVVHVDITTNTATQILRYGPKLEYVDYRGLQMYRYQADWYVHKTVRPQHLHFIILTQTYRSGPFPNLRYLRIVAPLSADARQLDTRQLLSLTPKLETLILDNLTIAQLDLNLANLPLQTLVLRRARLVSALPELPSTLSRLTIDTSWQANLVTLHFDTQRNSLPFLTHLKMTGFNNLTPDFLTSFLSCHKPNHQPGDPQSPEATSGAPLQHFSFTGTLLSGIRGLFRGPDNVLTNSPRLITPSLQTLELHHLPVDDDEIEALLTHHPTGLQTIDVSGTKVTGASIKMLADGLKELREIKVNHCPGIGGRDAIEYAQKRGIKVAYTMGEPEREGKGRRVREF
jgi:F-box/TPR repeat protein Pof3